MNTLEIDGFSLTRPDGSPSELFDYQKKALQKAFDAPRDNSRSMMFLNLGTGTGKTVLALAGAQELFNRGEIDLAVVFALKSVKKDFMDRAHFTNLRFLRPEGTKAKRTKEYQRRDFDVLILNYEKAQPRLDLDLILEIVKGRRVLFCLDETQKILLENTARTGVLKLIEAAEFSYVWPMSASVINGDPERFWRIFEFAPNGNPLGTLEDFKARYVEKYDVLRIRNKGRSAAWLPWIEISQPKWNDKKLEEVPEIVRDFMVTGRKTDPGIRENFKGLQFFPVPLEMSKEHRSLYELLREEAKGGAARGDLIQFYNAIRLTLLHPNAVTYSDGEVSKVIAQTMGDKLSKIENVKLDQLLDDVSTIIEGGDKVVVFTHWVNMSMNIISAAFDKHKIPYVKNQGGLSDRQLAAVRDEFKQSKTPMVFLSSDAGSHGINLPEARVVINYDIPMSYDVLMQRNDRIDRADSWLEGLEARAYYYEGTMEEKIWHENNARRKQAAALQGTVEVLGKIFTDEAVSVARAADLLEI